MLLALMLGISMIASGLRVGPGIAIEGAALRDCIGGPQAHNHDAPGQPPPRLLDAELRKDTEDGNRSGDPLTELVDDRFEPTTPVGSRLIFAARGSDAAQRAREGHGARGPPIG